MIPMHLCSVEKGNPSSKSNDMLCARLYYRRLFLGAARTFQATYDMRAQGFPNKGLIYGRVIDFYTKPSPFTNYTVGEPVASYIGDELGR